VGAAGSGISALEAPAGCCGSAGAGVRDIWGGGAAGCYRFDGAVPRLGGGGTGASRPCASATVDIPAVRQENRHQTSKIRARSHLVECAFMANPLNFPNHPHLLINSLLIAFCINIAIIFFQEDGCVESVYSSGNYCVFRKWGCLVSFKISARKASIFAAVENPG